MAVPIITPWWFWWLLEGGVWVELSEEEAELEILALRILSMSYPASETVQEC